MAEAPHAYDPDAPTDALDANVRPVTRALIGNTYPNKTNANVGAYGIQCACLQEITLEHLRIGYHPPCMRNVTIVLEEPQ